MLRKALLNILLMVAMVAGAQTSKTDRLDLRPGFREFKFKTNKDSYTASFALKRTNLYRWPDIVEVYTCPYHVNIGNTSTDSVHVFFLGNKLVRTTVFLKDTVSRSYINRFFGESEAVGEAEMDVADAEKQLQESGKRYTYATIERWRADMVRMERRVMYIRKAEGTEAKQCLDFYLNDFNDMIMIFTR